jgi:hypothetical protein
MKTKSPLPHLAAMSAFLLGMMPGVANANDWHVIELNESNLNYQRFIDDGRDPYIYPNVHKEALNLTTNLDVLRYFYLDTTVRSITDDAQYASVGLNLKLGVRLTDHFQVQYEHLSVHELDTQQTLMPKFPVSDSVGFVWKFYTSTDPRKALF